MCHLSAAWSARLPKTVQNSGNRRGVCGLLTAHFRWWHNPPCRCSQGGDTGSNPVGAAPSSFLVAICFRGSLGLWTSRALEALRAIRARSPCRPPARRADTATQYVPPLMGGRRQFGSVRRLKSGRWQASYWWEGVRHLAPSTFETKIAATRWLSTVDADLTRGGWVDPRAGQITFGRYAASWLPLRTDLRPKTRELYAGLLRRHLLPAFGQLELGRISSSHVRVWISNMSGPDGPGEATAARSYRLLRTIMNTAVADELILKNPCQVKGGGVERSPERPIATVPQVHALADAIGPRFRAAVLLAAFCSLRRGEILGLQRADVDLLHGT